ncbi:MAG TPA: hypothetical protein VFJ57_01320 [Solirubrobacterales bacterium]|nr:hypothetical protein [Solirubrobacterales bacterium]
MSRVALNETTWRWATSSEAVSFARNFNVFVYKRGTEEEVPVYSAEVGGTEIDQPLVTDEGGRPRGAGDVLAWVEAGTYDLVIGGQRVPWEAAKGTTVPAGGIVFKGAKDCSANPNYPAADAGHLYRVSVAGRIGGGSGTKVEVGDVLLCNTDGSAEGTQAEVGSKWNVLQTNIDGAVTGPASSVSGNLAGFEGTTGKVVKDSGLALDTDAALAANSDTRVASQKATKGYVDALLGGSDAVVYKGAKDCSANPNYPAASAGHLYFVSVAGKIGGASGIEVEAGDMFLCRTDGSAEGNQATVGSSWSVIQTNIVGAVTGPASATTSRIATFNGTSGKIIQDGGSLISDLVPKSLLTAKGQIVGASASGTPAAHAAGSNGQVLSAQSGESDGLKWIANNRIESHTFVVTPTVASLGGFFVRVASGETVKLIGIRTKVATGSWKYKVKRTTSGGSTSEPAKEKEVKTEVTEVEPGTELSDKDLLELIGESISSPGLSYVTFFIERSR